MRKMIIGNWKMNGLSWDLDEIGEIAALAAANPGVDAGLCLPATLIAKAAAQYPDLNLGGQDCHMTQAGAHTGCISAVMLVDAGARITIVGHSERRSDQYESDADIAGKAQAAVTAGLRVIICVGESEQQRSAGEALDTVLNQLTGSVPVEAAPNSLAIAYEPIWAIGTGRVPSLAEVGAVHDAVRGWLCARYGEQGQAVPILYGGSMNGENAASLLGIANVDGGLIGGASLTAAKFAPIIAAAATYAG